MLINLYFRTRKVEVAGVVEEPQADVVVDEVAVREGVTVAAVKVRVVMQRSWVALQDLH